MSINEYHWSDFESVSVGGVQQVQPGSVHHISFGRLFNAFLTFEEGQQMWRRYLDVYMSAVDFSGSAEQWFMETRCTLVLTGEIWEVHGMSVVFAAGCVCASVWELSSIITS